MNAVDTAGRAAITVAVLALMSHVMMVGADAELPSLPQSRQGAADDVGPVGIALAQGELVLDQSAMPAVETDLRAATQVAELPRSLLALGQTAGRLVASGRGDLLTAAGFDLASTTMHDRDAVELLQVGKVDFAVIGQSLSTNDVRAGLRGTLLGVELWSLAVPATRSLASLRSDQVRAVLTGQVRDWNELGLAGGAITLIVPADREAAERAARALVPGDPLAAGAVRVASDAAVFDQLMRMDGALGVVRAAVVVRDPSVRLLAIDGVMPSFDAFAQGRYTAGVPLVLATSGAPSGAGLRYLESVRSVPGADWLSLPQ